MENILLTFDWFNPDLGANKTKGVHWGTIHRLRTKQKSDCFYITKAQPKPPKLPNYALKILFYPPANNGYDFDNCTHGIKGLLDGLALAWGVDDSLFRPVYIDVMPPEKGGKITIEWNKSNKIQL